MGYTASLRSARSAITFEVKISDHPRPPGHFLLQIGRADQVQSVCEGKEVLGTRMISDDNVNFLDLKV